MKYRVEIREFEAGWGNRRDELLEFDTRQEAIDYAEAYNRKYNNKDVVPDWYMLAIVFD
jgi:hypothetical protein